MRIRSLLIAWIPALALGGCSESDNGMGPDPAPSGPPIIESFVVTAQGGEVLHGNYTNLRWRVPGATSVRIDPGFPDLSSPAGGAVTIRPWETTTYTLSARNEHGTASMTITVDVRYHVGFYVDPINGNDDNNGDEPAQAFATLTKALSRTQGGGTIYLTAGVYDSPLTIDGAAVSVYGGLDPATYFEGQPANLFITAIRPNGAEPLRIRSTGAMEIENIEFDARNGGAFAGKVENATVTFRGCEFDAEEAMGPVALLVEGNANVEARSCRIYASRPPGGGAAYLETAGVRAEGSSRLLVSNCFIYGGRGITRSSGVDVNTSGPVGIGLCTVGAEITSTTGGSNNSAAVRVRQGRPAIGGNILFTRGTGTRIGIIEEVDGAQPVFLEGNLLISVALPYDNFGPDPSNQEELNSPDFTVGNDPGTSVGDNIIESTLSVSVVLWDISQGDFHLIHPLRPPNEFEPNPAVNRGDTYLGKAAYGGPFSHDIDGDRRPLNAREYDIGADED